MKSYVSCDLDEAQVDLIESALDLFDECCPSSELHSLQQAFSNLKLCFRFLQDSPGYRLYSEKEVVNG